jgi:hypothetical protein
MFPLPAGREAARKDSPALTEKVGMMSNDESATIGQCLATQHRRRERARDIQARVPVWYAELSRGSRYISAARKKKHQVQHSDVS